MRSPIEMQQQKVFAAFQRRLMQTGLVAGVLLSLCQSSLAMDPSGMVTDLYRYYPQDTVWFLEFEPGQATQERFNRMAEKMVLAATESLPKPGSPEAEKAPDKPNQEQARKTSMEVLAFIRNWFTGSVSIGIWMDPPPPLKPGQKLEKPVTPDKNSFHMAVILPIRPGQDAAAFRHAFTENMVNTAGFRELHEGGLDYLKANTKGSPVFAFDEQNLVATDNLKTLQVILNEKKTPDLIQDNPLFQNNLSGLPAQRQGTFLYAMKGFGTDKIFEAFAHNATSTDGMKKQADKMAVFMANYLAAFPVGLMSIELDEQTWLARSRVIVPVQWEQVKEPALKTDLEAVFTGTSSISQFMSELPQNTAVALMVSNLDRLYDLYYNHALSDSMRQWVDSHAQSTLSKMGLALRQNVIELLASRVGYAMTLDPKIDMSFTYNRSPNTQPVYDKVLAILELSPDNVTLEKEPFFNGNTLYTAGSPKAPQGFKASFAQWSEDRFLLGTPGALKGMMNVKAGQIPALTEKPLVKTMLGQIPDNSLYFLYVDQPEIIKAIQRWMVPKVSANPMFLVSFPPATSVPDSSSKIGGVAKSVTTTVKSLPKEATAMFNILFGGLQAMAVSTYYDESARMVKGDFLIQLSPE